MKRVSDIQNFIIIACRFFIYHFRGVFMRSYADIKIRLLLPFTAVILLVFSSCTGKNRIASPTDTPTSGNIRILVDESFRPLIDAEIMVFTGLYTNARITPLYKPEVDVVNEFMKDSVKVMVTSRKLTDDQIKYLRDTLVVARTTTFAWDAVALVVNKSNPDSLLTYNDVKNIFTGKTTNWKDISSKSPLGQIRVIFDNPKSGNIRYFREKFDYNDPLPSNFYALNSNPEVIEFIEKNRDALGIISVNWISDPDDSLSNNFTNRITVAAVSQPYLDEGSYYRPLPGSIYDKTYPFTREIYLIKRESHMGLGSGFINWACAEQGQRIVLKSGLVPATMPIRLVQIKR